MTNKRLRILQKKDLKKRNTQRHGDCSDNKITDNIIVTVATGFSTKQ